MFKNISPDKQRLLELDLIDIFFRRKMRFVMNDYCFYMFEVLTQMISYRQSDFDLAIENPVEFILVENQKVDNKVRNKAGNVWASIAQQM